MSLFVAVVAGASLPIDSNRANGDWSCFLDTTQDGAIRKALTAVSKWNTEGHRNSPYRVLIAELDKEAVVPVKYKLVDYRTDEDDLPF